MADNNDKIDLIRALHFIWKNKRIYIISMITCISLLFIYCIYIIPDTYESTAVLYYPERAGGEIEGVSERDLMDDAVEILRQKRMLAIVEELLEDPVLPEKPLINGWKTELAAGIAAGGGFGSVIAVYLRKVKKKESTN